LGKKIFIDNYLSHGKHRGSVSLYEDFVIDACGVRRYLRARGVHDRGSSDAAAGLFNFQAFFLLRLLLLTGN